ncbi:hypothetical protein KP509_29G028200 [Ceratopteris richardii]|uniref:Protein kinase domain-containing protein n=1 Tax=Ceratopteris richardii TaxID=49495 RepID=A0A8T2R5K7_CERRI|nr:hypothetical protein KP509_29G028200 [Ceratopteris richardii]
MTSINNLTLLLSFLFAGASVLALHVSGNQEDCNRVISQLDVCLQGFDAGIPYQTIDSLIHLTADPSTTAMNVPKYNVGRVRYKYRLPFNGNDRRSNGNFPSFATTFTFQIKTFTKYNDSGDGIAFAITTDAMTPENSTGRFLGLMQEEVRARHQRFVALEFDTFQNFEPGFHDPSASHIGIDVSNLTSLKVVDTSNSSVPLYLYKNYTIKTWLTYNSSDSMVSVWATNDSTALERPLTPILQVQSNLSELFQNDTDIYAVITAASGNNSQHTILYSWNLAIEGSPNRNRMPLKLLSLLTAVPLLVVLSLASRAICRWRANYGSILALQAASRPVLRYRYRQLFRATSGFRDGTQVAVKQMTNGHADVTVVAKEVQIISGIQHRYLLTLKGWCLKPKERVCCCPGAGETLLVFEYMPKGSLSSHLHGINRGPALDSVTRLKIIHDVAVALEFLHSCLTPTGFVLHRDVKAANVLLTENMEAKLGDFGLARFISHHQILSEEPAGTRGYLAPEIIMREVSTKSDVYSFGILIIEIASGISPHDEQRIVPYAVLGDWLYSKRKNILEALDTSLHPMGSESEMWGSVLHLGLVCCQANPETRPEMTEVLRVLRNSEILEVPASWECAEGISNSGCSSTTSQFYSLDHSL